MKGKFRKPLRRSLSLPLLPLYGLGAQGWVPEIFANAESRTQTLIFSTVVIVLAVAVFTTWLLLVKLAQATSFWPWWYSPR